MFHFRKRKKQEDAENNELSVVRTEREAAERRLADTQRNLVEPLEEITQNNHIAGLVVRIVTKKKA